MLQAGFGTPPSIDVSLIVGFAKNNKNTQPTTVWDQTQVSIWLSILLTDGHLFYFLSVVSCQLLVRDHGWWKPKKRLPQDINRKLMTDNQ